MRKAPEGSTAQAQGARRPAEPGKLCPAPSVVRHQHAEPAAFTICEPKLHCAKLMRHLRDVKMGKTKLP